MLLKTVILTRIQEIITAEERNTLMILVGFIVYILIDYDKPVKVAASLSF
jgi:hypothetical protein